MFHWANMKTNSLKILLYLVQLTEKITSDMVKYAWKALFKTIEMG